MLFLRESFLTARPLPTIALLVMHAHVVMAAGDGALVAVPDEAAQAQAAALIREVYERDYETATTPAGRIALAKKMIDQACRTLDDPVARFVLLRVARDMAAQAGDAETAVDAVDRIAKVYDIDADAVKVDVLVKAAANARSTEARKAVAGHSLALAEALLDADDYPAANRLLETALAAARRIRDSGLVKKTMALRTRATEAGQAYAEVKKGLATLNEKPTDPEANLAVGRYYALTKGDWEKAIPMLALGDDAALSTLAQRDLQGPASPQEQVRLADDWWTLAETKEGPEKTALIFRAGTWYRRARPGLSPGLAQVKVDKRLDEVDKLRRPTITPESLRLPEGAVLVMTFEPDTFAAVGKKAYVSDLSGVGNHGELKGGPTPAAGKAGVGLLYDGKDDHVLLPTLRAHLVKDLEAVTFSMWVKPADAKDYGFLFDVGHQGKGACIALMWCGRTSQYRLDLPGHRGCMSEPVSHNQWQHLVARWDGSQESLYIDGKLHRAEAADDFTLNEATLITGAARFGGQCMRDFRGQRYFNGLIDEVAVYPRALSALEIETLYQMGSQGKRLRLTRRGKPIR